MNNKRYTDEEIIEALECCVKSKTMEDCLKSKCPFSKEWDLCLGSEPQKLYLDLINRQKSEIERLKGSTVVNNIMESQRIKREAKAEAYKEFADMVKKNIKEVWNYDNGTCSCALVLTKDIDNLLKEMVGEEK